MIISQYRTYCSKCHFTIFIGESIHFENRKPQHLNCKEAVMDGSTRTLRPSYEERIGKVSLKKLKRMIDESPLNNKGMVGLCPTSAAKGGGRK